MIIILIVISDVAVEFSFDWSFPCRT